MRIIRKNFPPGSHVIFVYNNCLYSGVIKSVGINEYGISYLNTTKDVTDHECMLRIHNEVFIPKKNCMRTAEVAVPHIDDCIKLKRGFGTIEDVYRVSRKKQIFPWFSINRFSDVYIDFCNVEYKDRLIFMMYDEEEDEIKTLYYRNSDPDNTYLIDVQGNKYNANWKYHKRSKNIHSKSFDEYNVVNIYLLNYNVNIYDENRIREMMKKDISRIGDILYKYENIPFKGFVDNGKPVTKPYLPNTRPRKFDCYGMKSKIMIIDDSFFECKDIIKDEERIFEETQGFKI